MDTTQSAAQPKDVLLHCNDLPWHSFGPGTYFKLLRVSEETGAWSVLIKMDKGSRFAPHKHLGAAEFFVTKGSFDYRAGTAKVGDYGYEPLGAIHGATTATEETEYTFTAYGPLAFLNEDGSVQMVFDFASLKTLWEEQEAGRAGSVQISVVDKAQAA